MRDESVSAPHDLFPAIIRELRRPPDDDPAAVARIMDAVRQEFRPESVSRSPGPLADGGVRPPRRAWMVGWLGLAAAVVAFVAVASTGWWRSAATDAPIVQQPEGEVVQFVFVSASAHRVSLVGSFNDWDPGADPLVRVGPDGMWSTEVALGPGRHEYVFNVDGTWIADVAAARSASDEFGMANSVIVVQ